MIAATRRDADTTDPDPPARRIGPSRPAWAGAWVCILALALWTAQLSSHWLVLAAVGAALWGWGGVRGGRRWTGAAAVLLWAAVGLGAGVEFRLLEVARAWPAVERRVEERAAAALDEALDAVVERGEEAVAGVERAAGPAPRSAGGALLFSRLSAVRRATEVSAVAVFDARGTPVAWSGEHRGVVPLAVRRGEQPYLFHEGPLFSYVYFTRPLRGGRTAAAAVLLESSLPSGAQVSSFAAGFGERHGVVPVFSRPDRARGETVWDWSVDRPILSVSFGALTQQNWWERLLAGGRWGVGVPWSLALLLLAGGWYRGRGGAPGLPVAVATTALLLAPLGDLLDAERLFSPLRFVLPLPWDVSLGMLLVLLIGAAVWLLTRLGGAPAAARRLPLWVQATAAAVAIPLGLEVMRRSATTGLLAGEQAGGFALLLATTLLLAIPLFLLLHFGPGEREGRRGRAALLASAGILTVLLAVAAVAFWSPTLRVPGWAAGVWAVPFGLLAAAAPPRRPRYAALHRWLLAGGFAGTVALSSLWVLHEASKLRAAEQELARLGTEADPFLDFLLRQFAEWADHFDRGGEDGVNLLYHSWVASGLAREGYEARLAIWRDGLAAAELRLSDQTQAEGAVAAQVVRAAGLRQPTVERYTSTEGLHYLLLAPLPDGRIVSVAVPPRSRLGRATALARFLQADESPEARSSVESLFLVPIADPAQDSMAPADGGRRTVHWMPTENGWRSEARAHFPSGWMHAHLFVRTSGLSLLAVRALLTLTALLAALAGCWAAARLLCGEAPSFLLPHRAWIRSFRGRVTLTLFVFFLVPTAVFGVVAYGAVSREVFRSAANLARRALEQTVRELGDTPLPRIGEQIGTDLLLYRAGSLASAASPEALDLGLFDAWLPPDVYLTFDSGEDLEEVDARRLGENEYLVGYRRLGPSTVLAAPIPLASDEIARRQTEFRDIALLMSLLGAAFSVVLSLLVGRTLSRPIDELSRAAAAVGSGNLRLRLPEERPDEFGGVYRSFNRMILRLRRARGALIRETRRTEAIVAQAATGVLALDAQGRVDLVNPRAAEVLGTTLTPGEPLPRSGDLLRSVSDTFWTFWSSGSSESTAELEVDGRIVRLRLRRLSPAGGPRGAVVSLEDVTREIRTARVLAWGEMARQVAHEIKNPLTPIKLAVQHLRRAFQDRRPDYDQILERNVEAILQEIERLGEIARAFSRFGTPQPEQPDLERVDVVRAVRETLTLYRGAGEGIHFHADLDAALGLEAHARTGELKEVLVNLLENAREALDGDGRIEVRAGLVEPDRVEIVVSDSGEGIPADLLPRIFEPHFSTRTSGTGLGLAIVRRMVDSWGGEIFAESEPGVGTRMHLRLRRVDGLRAESPGT